MANVLSSSATVSQNLEAFWREMMAAADDSRRNQFAVEHLPLVRQTAQRIHGKLPNLVELDDLVQVGMLGLHRAMLAFDPGRRVRFSTFAPFYIRGSIFDHLRATDWVPRLVRQRARRVEEATHQLQQRLGRTPSEHELAEYLKLSPQAFGRLRQEVRPVSQVSLSQSRFIDDAGRPVSQADLQADPRAPDPAHDAQRQNLKEFITRGFDRAERLVLTLYYYEQMTMKEIGLTLDLSESRVSQMHSSIIEQLKARLREQEQELELRK